MFTRGFKSWCEQASLQQRRALGLRSGEPLDAALLASHLGIDVWTPEDVPGLDADSLNTLLVEDPDSWSAVTLAVNSKHVIILNSAHSQARRASNITHEIAHVIIGHEPARVDITEDGLLMLNCYDKKQEEEATWLSGCLLLPREALLLIRRQRMNDEMAKDKYGVSAQMLSYRLRMSGVDMQMNRTRKSV